MRGGSAKPQVAGHLSGDAYEAVDGTVDRGDLGIKGYQGLLHGFGIGTVGDQPGIDEMVEMVPVVVVVDGDNSRTVTARTRCFQEVFAG
jgi:hypothetical protein